ncbi:hypothetical protein L3X39_04695 [Sabulilitoribacter multivorans]|uniref:Uncharacterized protein n=1 Tax=Flaviramulus multivorans TaxID=1304750 RepID=A0ABS9IID3_9FLAO|nr:hypothetical protein [Flaviramulus multivorans]MCF7559927.1 hypothetical protein [Flaviramulus multivorans]
MKVLVLVNFLCCYSQVVNKGVLYISDSTQVYFENEYTNASSGVFNNKGTLYFSNNYINDSTIKSTIGTVYFKCSINPLVNFSGINDALRLFSLPTPQNNRITYLGQKKRVFQIDAKILPMDGLDDNRQRIVFINKNSSELIKTNSLENRVFSKVELATNDYFEIWEQRLTNDSTPSIQEFTLNINLSD